MKTFEDNQKSFNHQPSIDIYISYIYILCIYVAASISQDFTPGAGAAAEEDGEEEEEEECSDTETIQTLGELSAVEPPDLVSSSNVPVCESKMDQKIYNLVMQFKEAQQVQPTVDRPCDKPKNANVEKVIDKPKPNPNILPSFVA